MARFDEQWTQVSMWCITVMLGLFASICIFTILHSSEDLLLSFLKETLLPTTDQDPRMELPVAGVIKCTINWNIKNTMGMDGLDYPWRAVDCLWFLLHPVGGWWEMWVMWARAPWGSAFVCNRWRSRPKNSVLTSSLSECQRPTYNRVWSLCPRPDSAGHSGSLSVWILSGI